ncbi:MAG: glycogen/starch/alpha-glucan phosphorylase [Candidatus Aenigmarchaeota archaeon]|nr:glycogen/starch/alpha-glucan phosphorylase [Candidatus Aenigmarchaeota archaeon]MDW8149052.1 glycogen/starch/alpha-glucan phosphorylase [Candidatus Aenigmarchaeota archaeon]
MDKPFCLNLSMENSLSKSSGKGGLGSLMACLFHQAYEEDYPLILVSLLYPYKSKQKKIDNIIETTSTIAENNLEDFGIEIVVRSNWYDTKLRVFKYPLSNKAIAFFLYLGLEKNEEWLKRLEVYGEHDEGQVLLTRYLLAEGAIELMKKLELDFDVLHLQESDTALAIKPALSYNKNTKIIYTIHTPMSHGHKSFSIEKIISLYGNIPKEFEPGIKNGRLYLTDLASHYACKIFTVSKIQVDIEKNRQPIHSEKISSISNAVHKRWINEHLKKLFDNELSGWRQNIYKLREASKIEDYKIEEVLKKTREDLVRKFESWYREGEVLSNFSSIPKNVKIFTFAKRIVPYKRPLEFLKIIEKYGSNNSVYIFSGVLCAMEEYEREFLKTFAKVLEEKKIAFVLNFNEEKAYYLVSGSDFWVNIPISWMEASGTSHMKASVNGRITISTPFGTVIEYVKHGYNGILVDNNLTDLAEKLSFCESLTPKEYILFSKNCISSSPYILMERMFGEYKEQYIKAWKEKGL